MLPKIKASEERKRLKPRHPYTVEQLNILFSSDWYDPVATNWRGRMKWDLGARYWVPLLCLFHGLRIREALQLRAADVKVEEVPLLSIQVDEGGADGGDDADDDRLPTRTLKNDATKRTVPVHPTLLQLGFLSFVKDATACGDKAPLFPSSIPTRGGKKPMWGRAYEQRFVPHVRDTLAFGQGYGNHSFRHTTEDCLRNTQLRSGTWPSGLVPFYTGRQAPRAMDRSVVLPVGSEIDYGNGGDPNLMLPWISRLEYPGLRLPMPFKSWLKGRSVVEQELIVELDRDWGRRWRDGNL